MKQTRTQRLIRIVQLLQAGRGCDVATFARELSVSRRTVFRDIAVLRDAEMAIEFDAEAERYTAGYSFFLRPTDLSVDEGLALMLMTRKMVDERVLPASRAVVSAGLKIESALPEDIREHCGAMLEGVTFSWSKLSDVDPVSDVVMEIEQAISEKRKLRLLYDSYYDRAEITTVLHPYRLLFRGRGWYVIGYAEKWRQVRTFKLERIVSLETLDQRFRPDRGFSLTEYFGNAWQMIRGDTPYHVEVHFGEKVAGNVEEVSWHPTQRTRRRSDGTLVFEVDVDGIDEIAWWVLGYGDQAVVREPDELRALIASHARQMAKYYEKHVSPAPVARA